MEKRVNSKSILLRFGSKAPGRLLELFDATQWPDKPEADAGLYRVRIDGRWWMPGGKKYVFVTRQGLARLLEQELAAPGVLAAYEQRKPELRKGDRCRWSPDDPEKPDMRCTLHSEPVMWLDGIWRVLIVATAGQSTWACCDELTLLDHFGRELCRLPKREGA